MEINLGRNRVPFVKSVTVAIDYESTGGFSQSAFCSAHTKKQTNEIVFMEAQIKANQKVAGLS